MTSRAEGARIFIVDDQEPNVRLLERMLARAGFDNVRPFMNGQAMLDAIGTDEPDLVLLDLHMPAPDGFAVLESIRSGSRIDRHLPVLVLTADVARGARSRALAAGANDYLLKPFDAEEVVLRVRNLAETGVLHRVLRTTNSDLKAEVAARTNDLQDSEAQWAAVTTSLGRLGALATPEATADAICEALGVLPDLAVVAIVAFGPSGAIVPLAGRSTAGLPLPGNRPLSDDLAGFLREQVSGGPWIGPRSALPTRSMPTRFARDVTAIALMPLRTDAGLAGILIAGALGADGQARLGQRVPALAVFAALSAALLAPAILERQRDNDARERISTVISRSAFVPVVQPIVALGAGRIVGYEALTRFSDGTSPDRMFAEAAAVGLGLDLEIATLTAAMTNAARLERGQWLSLNVSPDLVLESRRLSKLLDDSTARVVLEISEHVPITDYSEFRSAVKGLAGVRCAIDDAGAGYSSFRHIVELRPDYVKLDIGLVRSIEHDPARQALVAGMAYFAVKTGCELIAEGIETRDEREALRSLAVDLGQGYLLGRPGPFERVSSDPVALEGRRPASSAGSTTAIKRGGHPVRRHAERASSAESLQPTRRR